MFFPINMEKTVQLYRLIIFILSWTPRGRFKKQFSSVPGKLSKYALMLKW